MWINDVICVTVYVYFLMKITYFSVIYIFTWCLSHRISLWRTMYKHKLIRIPCLSHPNANSFLFHNETIDQWCTRLVGWSLTALSTVDYSFWEEMRTNVRIISILFKFPNVCTRSTDIIQLEKPFQLHRWQTMNHFMYFC